MENPENVSASVGSLQESFQENSLYQNEGLEFSSLGITGGCALLLLLIHWIIPKIRKLDSFDDGILNSIAGGLALGYVFLHALPSLILNISSLKGQIHNHFLSEEKNLLFVIFMFALAGFFVLYVLEKLAHDKSKEGKEGGIFIYYSHIVTLTYLSFSVALIMPIMVYESISSLLLFTFIMRLHFVLEDHAISHHFPSRFNHVGRYIIMGGVGLGWVIGAFITSSSLHINNNTNECFSCRCSCSKHNENRIQHIRGKITFSNFCDKSGR